MKDKIIKKIVFHPHALYKMDKRNITQEIILDALHSPDDIKEGKIGRYIAHKASGGYILRVVYEEDIKHIVVITAYWARKKRYANG